MAAFMIVWMIICFLIYGVVVTIVSNVKKKKEREIQEKIEKEENKKRIYLESIKPVDRFTIEFDEVSTNEDVVNKKVSTIIKAGSGYEPYFGYKNDTIEEMNGEKIFKYIAFCHSGDDLEIDTIESGEVISAKVLLKGNLIGVVPQENIESLQKSMYTYPFHNVRILLTGGPYKFFDYVKDKIVTVKDPFGYKVEITFYKNDPTVEFESL
ncbi:hypothetical protein SAMN05878443_1322 [Carnobacterium alterfunditum]|uniref:Uncharacterized protein n=1 Tax=Carnobacterium alterfunditum TaxID=28230 RepID=A0A1N6GN18_9LACT|nr:hypothetical protein [Carnobacterium alterfunditum]SIO08923.1 hypothetical protein SAMN05878443_1322 [Carnobacterium alterfunditum]